MSRFLVGAAILVAAAAPGSLPGQTGFRSKRETYDVSIAHPGKLALPNVKRIAIRDVGGVRQCARDLKARLAEAITSSGKLELIDRSNLNEILGEQSLQSSAWSNPETAVKLGQLLGPAAIIVGQVVRCAADTSAVKSQAGYKEKNGRQHVNYFRETIAHLSLTVQIIDITTSKVHSASRINVDVPVMRSAQDVVPDAADGDELLGKTLDDGTRQILQLILPWQETVRVVVHADKECDLQPAAGLIRVGNFVAAAETMQKAIDRQCDAPDDKIALAKAYHNKGVALTYAGHPEDGLAALQQSSLLWKGDISEHAIEATQKLIAAAAEQRRQDAQAVQAGRRLPRRPNSRRHH